MTARAFLERELEAAELAFANASSYAERTRTQDRVDDVRAALADLRRLEAHQ